MDLKEKERIINSKDKEVQRFSETYTELQVETKTHKRHLSEKGRELAETKADLENLKKELSDTKDKLNRMELERNELLKKVNKLEKLF